MRLKLGTIAAATVALASSGVAVHPALAGGPPAPAVPPGYGQSAPVSSTGYGSSGHRGVVMLTVADNGRTVHVARGREVRVTLAVDLKRNPEPVTWWRPVTESGDALTALPQTLMARRGVTNARYRATARGGATLTSTRPVCAPQPGAPTCHSMQGWRVTIDVR